MCFHCKLTKKTIQIQNRFKATFDNEEIHIQEQFNAFEHPKAPVITNENPNKIEFFQWGLIPHWAKDTKIQNSTLNARIETIKEKPSFRDCVNQRCLIPADGFFEWQWLDEKGKKKQKYHIYLPNDELFAFAGLWSKWVDKSTGEIFNTYTILTTDANPLMAKIHNTKKRMPVILDSSQEKEWLNGSTLIMQNDYLIADII